MKFLSVILLAGAFFISCSTSANEYIVTYQSEFAADGCRLLSIDGPHHWEDGKPYYNVHRFCNGAKPPESAFVYVQQVKLINIKDLK